MKEPESTKGERIEKLVQQARWHFEDEQERHKQEVAQIEYWLIKEIRKVMEKGVSIAEQPNS